MSIDIQLAHQHGAFQLDVEFALPGAGVTALYGPSGAGKSTIINAVAGLLRPDKGRVVLNGRPLLDVASRVFIPPSRRRIGYVFQDARLFPHLSVRSNLLYGAKRAERPLSDVQVSQTFKLLGVEHLLERRPRNLSGGERQRVALGRALLTNPQLLLLDEPLSGVDETRKHEILPLLEKIRDAREIPMLYVSHSLDEVSRLADEVVVVNNGQVAGSGSVFETLSRMDLLDVAGASAAGAVIEAHVVGHREEAALTALAFEGNELLIPRINHNVGDTVRVRIRALDVTLALQQPTDISANNVWRATISAIRAGDGPHADVRLECGSAALLARITRYSSERLGLEPGRVVYAIIKSVTVDRGGSASEGERPANA